MRISLVGNDDVRVANHVGSCVGVKIERYRDRHLVADNCADTFQQFAFAILTEFGDHRAVQAEQDAVERFFLGFDGSADAVRHIVESLAGNLGAGFGMRGDHVADFQPASRAPSRKPASSVGASPRSAMATSPSLRRSTSKARSWVRPILKVLLSWMNSAVRT